MSKNWFEKIIDGIKAFFDWLGSDKTMQDVEGIIRLILLVASIVEKFNTPLPGTEKAALVRRMVQILKYASDAEVEELCLLLTSLKATGRMESLHPWELDKLCGDGIAAFLACTPRAGDDTVDALKRQY